MHMHMHSTTNHVGAVSKRAFCLETISMRLCVQDLMHIVVLLSFATVLGVIP